MLEEASVGQGCGVYEPIHTTAGGRCVPSYCMPHICTRRSRRAHISCHSSLPASSHTHACFMDSAVDVLTIVCTESIRGR
ncbi:hypothetical protein L227DRAFT_332119 [Lentinus tigrinus ALCF2SS1-6]|uniref:Uncharacterized protein n=1 Tax=Lentinus tigrinus ALCF2SS1-6 TaxID=1328759 RepID=A0A5C2RWJ5_9APHY|nr:hypothetical protein L227DRAFT_332119 [Lentinus tigrinus ALCF2SS1-6]